MLENNEALVVVNKALQLENEMDINKRNYDETLGEKYPDIQPPPVKRMVQRMENPPIEHGMKFSFGLWLGVTAVFGLIIAISKLYSVFAVLLMIWWIGYPIFYNVKKSSVIERTRNSAEYQAACANIDNQFQMQLQYADYEWKEQMAYYNSVIVPEYNSQKALWESDYQDRLHMVRMSYDESVAKLEQHYSETRIIPQKYHNIQALEYIYTILNTSQYSLKEAIDDYERYIQQQLELQKLEAQRAANELAYQQAELTAEQNDIMEKTRRDQNIANIVSAVQRHNTNKKLNQLNSR